MSKTVRFVFVPADITKPLEDLSVVTQNDEDEVGCVMNYVRDRLSDAPIALGEFKETMASNLRERQPDFSADMITDEQWMKMASTRTVESIPLQSHKKLTQFIGVNMYVDDGGSFKQLPFNRRAELIAARCGQLLQIRGDAYISRVYDDENRFQRLDIDVNEVSRTTEWLNSALDSNVSFPSLSPLIVSYYVCDA